MYRKCDSTTQNVRAHIHIINRTSKLHIFSLPSTRRATQKGPKRHLNKTKTHKHGDFSGDLSGPIEAVVSFRCVVCVRVSLTLSIVSLSLSLSLRLFLARDLEKKCISLFLDMMEKRESNRALLA
jgi:hypothetical protein